VVHRFREEVPRSDDGGIEALPLDEGAQVGERAAHAEVVVDQEVAATGHPRGPPARRSRLPSPGPRMPQRYPSSADTDAMVARVAPAILALLADGVPRSKRVIAAELADRHPKDEVARTLMRLAVTDRVEETGGKYTLAPVDAAGRA
jgi:hypothetical protein